MNLTNVWKLFEQRDLSQVRCTTNQTPWTVLKETLFHLTPYQSGLKDYILYNFYILNSIWLHTNQNLYFISYKSCIFLISRMLYSIWLNQVLTVSIICQIIFLKIMIIHHHRNFYCHQIWRDDTRELRVVLISTYQQLLS